MMARYLKMGLLIIEDPLFLRILRVFLVACCEAYLRSKPKISVIAKLQNLMSSDG